MNVLKANQYLLTVRASFISTTRSRGSPKKYVAHISLRRTTNLRVGLSYTYKKFDECPNPKIISQQVS